MARIAGVVLPNGKRVEIALTYITGIGLSTSRSLLEELKINPSTPTEKLTEDELKKLRDAISKVPTEGDLRRKVTMDIKRLQEINCYRGQRHKRRLPVRGQRTQTNARTRKGHTKNTVANKKKATK